MGKILKLGFAMGGGVSLGTFSGAALSEAIKLAILHGGYYQTNERGEQQFHTYDKVEIDVFSGASAGSMSLAIMLRGLAHQTEEEWENAIKALDAQNINKENSGLNNDKWEDLIAAQVVQNLQEEIWAKEITIDKLLGTTTEQKADLTFEGGLLRRGALEEIANKYFQLDEAFAIDFAKRRILANEVIFASTLSNLTGFKYDCREGEEESNPNFAGSKDAFTSYSHRELRVFHLFFERKIESDIEKEPEWYPRKWLRYHLGDKMPGFAGSIREKTAWSRMVATSMACGAFPFAFEPVALERFKFEYGKDLWPTELTPEICQLATEAKKLPKEEDLSYPFSYVDGGTFNNEPVREAFRLAAFQDAEEDRSFDRLIVFVDPSLGEQPVSFRVPVHQQFSMQAPRKWLGTLDGHDLIRRTTLDRLIPHLGNMLSMLTNECRVNEMDKIHYISKLFEKKDQYYQLLYDITKTVQPNASLIKNIQDHLNAILAAEKLNSLVPRGALTLKGELIRIVKDQQQNLDGLSATDIDAFLKGGLGALPPNLHLPLLNALYIILLDLLMDLSGKNQDCKILALAPVAWVDGKAKNFPLPGRFLQAFSGFTSPRANEHTIACAKYCTTTLMRELKVVHKDVNPGPEPFWTSEDDKTITQDFKSKLAAIHGRIDNLLLNSSLIDVFPGLDRMVLSRLSGMIKDQLTALELKDDPYWSFIFMIPVDDKNFEIDGAGRFNDTAAVQTPDGLYLIAQLRYYYDEKNARWSGKHVQDNKLVIDRNGLLTDRHFCTIELPPKEQLSKANLMPNPIFLYRKLKNSDKNKQLKGLGWKIKPGVTPVERQLLTNGTSDLEGSGNGRLGEELQPVLL